MIATHAASLIERYKDLYDFHVEEMYQAAGPLIAELVKVGHLPDENCYIEPEGFSEHGVVAIVHIQSDTFLNVSADGTVELF